MRYKLYLVSNDKHQDGPGIVYYTIAVFRDRYGGMSWSGARLPEYAGRTFDKCQADCWLERINGNKFPMWDTHCDPVN